MSSCGSPRSTALALKASMVRDVPLGVGPWGRPGRHRSVLQVGQGAQTQRDPPQVCHDSLRGALRQVIGSRPQGDDRGPAWPTGLSRHPKGDGGARRGSTRRAQEAGRSPEAVGAAPPPRA